MPKITTFFTIFLAPIILIIIKYFAIEDKSFSYLFLHLIPAGISSVFFMIFLSAYLYKKEMVLYFTKKFYTKELNKKEVKYLSRSDLYWVFVTFLNTIIQIIIGLYASETIWVFYSSVGWYIYLFLALTIHIAYAKIFVLRS